MSEIFYTSDLHWGHEATCTKFTRNDGTPLRPFSCAQEMDEEMIRRWNATVSPNDKVYVLGDVAMRSQHLKTMGRVNGKKTLIRGNHDIFDIRDYLKYFSEVHAIRYPETREFVMTHIPLHPDSVRERYKYNIHGHLHANKVMTNVPYQDADGPGGSGPMRTFFRRGIDPMYLNVCVEQTDYTPISHDEVLRRIRQQQEDFDNG